MQRRSTFALIAGALTAVTECAETCGDRLPCGTCAVYHSYSCPGYTSNPGMSLRFKELAISLLIEARPFHV
jgi:hypothetical protein